SPRRPSSTVFPYTTLFRSDQIPEAISVEEMDRLLLFVPEDDQQTVLDAYDKDDSTYDTEAYVLKSSVSDNEDEIGELEDLLQGRSEEHTSELQSRFDLVCR